LFGTLAVLNCIGAAQAAMFGAALVLRRSASQRDRLLGFLSIATGVFIAGAVMYTTRAVFSIPALGFVHEPILFTCAPLLYLYVRECLEPIGLQRRDALHFLPALVCLLVLIPAYATTGDAKIALLERAFEGSLPWYVYRSAAVLMQSAIYITLVLLVAKRAKPALRESSDDGGVGNTLKLVVGLVCVAFVLGVLRLLTVLDLAGGLEIKQNLLIPLLASLLFGYLSFAALRQGGSASSKQRRAVPVQVEISPEQRGKLLHVMETEQAYLDQELSLQRLADRIGIPPRLLSDLINREFGQNVTDYINSYRIEEAKRRICDERYKNTTLLALAEDVGFKSKSNFNLLFKRQTTMTPTEYRRAVSNS